MRIKTPGISKSITPLVTQFTMKHKHHYQTTVGLRQSTFHWLTTIAFFLGFSGCQNFIFNTSIQSNWEETPDRYWVGQDYWANRLQDWTIHDGRLECVDGRKPLRTVHLLSGELRESDGVLKVSVNTGLLNDSARNEQAWTGFLIGAGSLNDDYRLRALIHQAHGNHGGLIAAVDGTGKIIFLDNADHRKAIPASRNNIYPKKEFPSKGIRLKLKAETQEGKSQIVIQAFDKETGVKIDSAAINGIPAKRVSGNIALAAHIPANKKTRSFWFSDWKVRGSKLAVKKNRRLGPVMGVQYAISRGTLHLTAQMAPVSTNNLRPVILDVAPKGSKKWKEIGRSEIVTPGYNATFGMKHWDTQQAYNYRIFYPLAEATDHAYFYGTIPKEPTYQNDFVAAAFTGNSNMRGSFGTRFNFSAEHIWFPHNDIVRQVKKHEPDFLIYSGDQVYEDRPTSADKSGGLTSYLDYLYKWYLFLWAHGELTKDIPSVSIPGDHDVYQGNFWGADGNKAKPLPEGEGYPKHYRNGLEAYFQQDRGGYIMPPEFVNMVQRTQTSHLPAPYDATPVKQGIEVYYTDITYGGMSFAILEDKKFKSSPSEALPEASVVNGLSRISDIGPEDLSAPHANLYGQRQLQFLDEWAESWEDADMKATISQTILACLSTRPDTFLTNPGTPNPEILSRGVIPKDYEKAKDMGSNGWPASKRNKALKAIRKSYAFMIAGGQHLASLVHHGTDEWEDAGYSFCVPSIANLWARRWFPPDTGRNHQAGMPPYTGRYFDGFGNRMTVWAVANPYKSLHTPRTLHDRTPGYGIIRFHKNKQSITLECWPRYATTNDDHQYPGWPKTIEMVENYGRQAPFRLPIILTEGLTKNPVYKLYREPGQALVYARRARDSIFQPRAFKTGSYTLIVGEPETNRMDTLRNIQPIQLKKQIVLDFSDR